MRRLVTSFSGLFVAALSLGGLLLGSACRTEASGGVSASASVSVGRLPPAPSVTSVPSAVFTPMAPPRDRAIVPAGPSGATPEERKANVLALLAGGDLAAQLPLVDVGEGKTFDATLRDRVAPRVAVGYPKVRMGTTKVVGDLDPMVVQRIVRQNFGRYRMCYETALDAEPNLEGKIVVEFSVEPSGSVKVKRATGDLKDKAFIDCVRDAFGKLTFPARDHGKVEVVYPIMFSPG
jgi:hypothetical protein